MANADEGVGEKLVRVRVKAEAAAMRKSGFRELVVRVGVAFGGRFEMRGG